MSETLEITKEAAIKAHDEASTKGKTLLENLFGKRVFQKDITERVKSIEDAIRELGNNDVEVIQLNRMKSIGLQNHIIGNQELIVIAKALNEGWQPDWQNDNEYKYFPWFDMDNSSSAGRFSFHASGLRHSLSAVGSRLCFKSKDLATYAGTQFLDIYKDFFTVK